MDRPAEEAAVAAVTEPLREITLANGIVLTVRPVPPRLIREATSRVPAPQIPKVWIADGDRHEENPDDPEYQDAIRRHPEMVAEAAATVGVMAGTAIKYVPEGVEPPESDEWIQHVEAVAQAAGMELTIRREPALARYYDWIRYYAAADEADLFMVTRMTTSGYMLSQAEVDQMVGTFRRLVGRPADPGLADPPGEPAHRDLRAGDVAGGGVGVGDAGGGTVLADPVDVVGDDPAE